MFLSLGEVMLRFCPGDRPLRAATEFTFTEGGGEYNVARALSRCFGHSAGIATALVDNEIGHLVHQLMLSSGLDTSNVIWRDFDGIGSEVRNPLYFAERGFGHRSPKATMDRGHSAPSQLAPGDFNWDELFGKAKVTWLHTGGIFAGLSSSTAELTEEAMSSARRHGVKVSYDPNFRASLWKSRGGPEAAATLNRKLAHHADILFGIAPLLEAKAPPTEPGQIEALITRTCEAYPQLRSIVLGRRAIHSTSRHSYAATLWHAGEIRHLPAIEQIEVLDRIGSGDAFAAGYLHGQLTAGSQEESARIGQAAAALAMSTPGDALLVSKQDVLDLAHSGAPSESR